MICTSTQDIPAIGSVVADIVGDTMLGSLMQHNDIDGVIVGADRIVKNGDTANKVSLPVFTSLYIVLLC